MNPLSKTLILLGVLLILAGLLWHFAGERIPFGKLPGDIRIEGENSKVYFPITTSIILSVLLSVIAYFFKKWF